jgi:hypothetical protein
MEQHYKGPKIVESYLMKKKSKLQGKQGERAVLRYFKFNLTEKSFTYKDDQDTKEIKMIYTGKDLKSFVDSVDKEDQNICEYPHGFQIITSGKPFVLFAQNKELYSKWIRILNFHFNKIDILNPLAFLNSNTVNTVEQTNTKIIQNTVVKYHILIV